MIKFLFFILYIIFLSFISFSFVRVISFSFSFFFYLFLSSTCPLSSVLSLPPSFIFLFSSRTFQTSEKRERERRKDKAGGSIGHRKDRAGAALPRPRPTAARPPPHHQAGLDRLFFFLCDVRTLRSNGERVREKKKSREERKNWYNSSLYDFLIKKFNC